MTERDLDFTFRPLASDIWPLSGAVAQPGERLLCKQEVAGSTPVGSTIQMSDDRCQMPDGAREE